MGSSLYFFVLWWYSTVVSVRYLHARTCTWQAVAGLWVLWLYSRGTSCDAPPAWRTSWKCCRLTVTKSGGWMSVRDRQLMRGMLTWCQNGISLAGWPADDAAHLGQHVVFHQDENGRNLVREPLKAGFETSLKPVFRRAASVTYMLVLAAAVSHSPASETISSPHESWLK